MWKYVHKKEEQNEQMSETWLDIFLKNYKFGGPKIIGVAESGFCGGWGWWPGHFGTNKVVCVSVLSGGSRISQTRDLQAPRWVGAVNPLISQFFTENCMKMKEF